MKFFSLGPTCLGAEILKAGGLRKCTYGFDWVRSGSFYIEKFFDDELSEFILKYVHNPCVPLVQNQDPTKRIDNTVNPEKIEQIFGFDYLYTPHRDYNNPETKKYLSRSFNRLKSDVQISDKKVFLLCDYENKNGYTFFRDEKNIISNIYALIEHSRQYRVKDFKVIMLRITLNAKNNLCAKQEEKRVINSDGLWIGSLIKIVIPSSLDDEDIRHLYYSWIARRVLAQIAKQ